VFLLLEADIIASGQDGRTEQQPGTQRDSSIGYETSNGDIRIY
jgi:hypothetical protein